MRHAQRNWPDGRPRKTTGDRVYPGFERIRVDRHRQKCVRDREGVRSTVFGRAGKLDNVRHIRRQFDDDRT